MSRPPYFAFYPVDFAGDLNVESMTTLQVGAYILLLCKAWQADPPASLPNDDAVLARLARLTPAEWSEVKAGVLAPFSLGTDDRWHQKRLRKEYEQAMVRMKKNSRHAKVAADARWNARSMPGAMPGVCPSNAIQTQTLKSPSGTSGGKPPEPPKPRKLPDTIHAALIEVFRVAWGDKYGSKYPFQGKVDGPAFAWFREELGGDADRFRRIVQRYLADPDPFIAKENHPVRLLRHGWVKWCVDPSQPAQRPLGLIVQPDVAPTDFTNV